MVLKPFFLKKLSLQKRLPLLVCLLLMGVIVLFSIISYLGIKKIELDTGKQRVTDLALQAGNMFSESIKEDYLSTRNYVAATTIPELLSDQNKSREEKKSRITQMIRQSSHSICVEIIDTSFQTILLAGDSLFLPQKRDYSYLDEHTMAGKIYNHNDSIFYSITVPVIRNNKLLGYFIRHRRVKVTSQMLTQFSKLAGHGAKLYIGNRDNSFFTDLFKPVPYTLHLPATRAGKDYSYTNDDGIQMMGAFQFVPGTPWLVALEFPSSVVAQGASKFLLGLLLSGSIMIICGTGAAWLIGRNLVRPLKKLTNAVSTISEGKFAEVEIEREDEVGKLAAAFNKMSQNLKDTNGKMEEKIKEAELLNTQLRMLSARQQNIREEERKRIAREMHDELGQLLTGFKMDIQLLKNHMPANSGERVAEHIESMNNLVDDAIRFVRRLSSQLREGPLDDLGLIAAIQWYIQEFTRRYNIPVSFNCAHNNLGLSPQIKTGLFRICQESLTNIARHSNATEVQINLKVEDNVLLLTVKDNGKGFSTTASQKKGSLGLLGMNERAIMIGAMLSLRSFPGKGTEIKVKLPV